MAGDNFDALRKVLSDKPRRMEGSGTSGALAHMRNIRDWRENVAEEASPPVLAALLAERDALQAKVEAAWRPIKTAPKDGTFLVFMPRERTQIQVAKFHPNVRVIGGAFAFDLTAPTHWMPLPAPPAIVRAAAAALDAGRMDGEKG